MLSLCLRNEHVWGASRLWLAYSGGLDSEVLLHLLLSMPIEVKQKLTCVHINHQLSVQAPMMEAHCRERCEMYQVSLDVLVVDAQAECGQSPEAAARAARYGALKTLIEPGDLLLTAQHQDDQLETFLLQCFRGSGLKGLSAMPSVAPFGEGTLARPLLQETREELKKYAHQYGLKWFEDASNENLAFDRNYLRHTVIPMLKVRWPSISKTVARSAKWCAESQALLQNYVSDDLHHIRGSRKGTVSVQGLLSYESAPQKHLIRTWVVQQGHSLPSEKKCQAILETVLKAAPDKNPCVSWGGSEIRRYRDDLFVLNYAETAPLEGEYVWDINGNDSLANLGVTLDPKWLSEAGMDINQWCDAPLTVRFGELPTRIRPRGRANSRLLKSLFQEKGIPPWERARTPTIYGGNTMIAVYGVCICEPSSI